MVMKINLGSRPNFSVENMVTRPGLAAILKGLFLLDAKEKDSMCSGAIIEPSRTGKTLAIKDLCNRYPEGVLYHEVREPKCYVEALTKENKTRQCI